MLSTCEVKDCKDYSEHEVGIGRMSVGVCTVHRKGARKLARKYAMRLLEVMGDVHDEFLDAVHNMGEEKKD